MSYSEIKTKLAKNNITILTLEEDYLGSNSNKTRLQCEKGHIWNSKVSNILSPNRLKRLSKGCPQCAKNIYIKQSKDIALSKVLDGHLILDSFLKEGKNKNNRYYKIQCPNNHIYEKRNAEMTSGCPECSKKTFVGQERVRLIFEHHFNKKFPSSRPNWLINPLTGKRLELDGYCEELKIAFEYQGRQHFSNDTEFGGDFENQKQRDIYKKELCLKHGVNLVIINQPRFYDPEKFFNSVKDNCSYQGVLLTATSNDINFNHINDENSLVKKYNDFSDFVKEKGYTLISTSLSTMEDLLNFSCKEGHIFKLKASTFKTMINTEKYRDEPCLECHNKVSFSPKKNVIHSSQEDGLLKAQEAAKHLHFTLLSTEYNNINEPLQWKCSHGHIFHKSYRQILRNQTGEYCDSCKEQKLSHPKPLQSFLTIESKVLKTKSGIIKDVSWLKDFSNKHNLTLMEENYLGDNIKHSFKCNNNHLFTSTISNLLDKEKRNSIMCIECSNKIITIETCKKFAENNNLVCLENEYKNVNTIMKWQCSHGHIFEKNYRSFLRSKTQKYCPDCT